jgi:hypothetical protein
LLQISFGKIDKNAEVFQTLVNELARNFERRNENGSKDSSDNT